MVTRPNHKSAGDDARKALNRAIHAMARELALEDDSYRDLLARVAGGKRSCTDMTRRELNAVADELRRLGAGRKRRQGPKRAGGRKMAPGGQASKMRALWLSLYHLAEVDDPSEGSLARFVEETTGIDALEWLGPADADKAIKALRGWCRRIGFHEPMARRVREIDAARKAAGLLPGRHGFAAKVTLIEMQIERLRAAGLTESELAVLGIWLREPATRLHLLDLPAADVVIERLGAEVRLLKAERGDG